MLRRFFLQPLCAHKEVDHHENEIDSLHNDRRCLQAHAPVFIDCIHKDDGERDYRHKWHNNFAFMVHRSCDFFTLELMKCNLCVNVQDDRGKHQSLDLLVKIVVPVERRTYWKILLSRDAQVCEGQKCQNGECQPGRDELHHEGEPEDAPRDRQVNKSRNQMSLFICSGVSTHRHLHHSAALDQSAVSFFKLKRLELLQNITFVLKQFFVTARELRILTRL
mmetsp:Transcript_86808/g.165984  ORF Transcript_86808/g.165984 Transcript_86808/m.165984 type:complete len:221 (+) Transcript_86808:119-781(+)